MYEDDEYYYEDTEACFCGACVDDGCNCTVLEACVCPCGTCGNKVLWEQFNETEGHYETVWEACGPCAGQGCWRCDGLGEHEETIWVLDNKKGGN